MNYRKGLALVLSSLVCIVSIIYILDVWELIDVANVARKSLATLFIIIASSLVILFINSIITKKEDEQA